MQHIIPFTLFRRLKYVNEGELFLEDCVGTRDPGHAYIKPGLDWVRILPQEAVKKSGPLIILNVLDAKTPD